MGLQAFWIGLYLRGQSLGKIDCATCKAEGFFGPKLRADISLQKSCNKGNIVPYV